MLCIQRERAWSATEVDPEGLCVPCRKDKPENAGRNDIAIARHIGLLVRSALPEELNQMAAGGDVKETVMTMPFLRACITNMIADQKRKSSLTVTREGHCQFPKPHGNGSQVTSLGSPW